MELSLGSAHTLHIRLKKSLFIYYPNAEVVDSDVGQASAAIYPNAHEQPSEAKLLIDGAGEFEVDDLSIRGVDLKNNGDGTAYQLASEAAAVIVLPPSSSKAYTDAVLEGIGVGQVLVMVVPDDTSYVVADAAKTIRLFEPQVVIPISASSKNPNISKLLTELGASDPKTTPVFKTKDLATLGEVLQIIVLDE